MSTTRRLNLKGDGEPERLTGWSVSANFLDLLRVRLSLGRGFLPNEDQPGQDNKVAILTDAVWKRYFGGGANIIGRLVRLNAETYTVIGVLPPNALYSPEVQFLIPHVVEAKDRNERGMSEYPVIGRLKPGVGRKQAEEELWAIKQRLAPQYPKFKANWRSSVVPVHEGLTGDIRPRLLLVFGAVACLLLIACTNVANLLLARAASRQREMAIRAALGAGRWRVIRQALTESGLLGLIGGAWGLGLAYGGARLICQLEVQVIPLAGPVHLDTRMLAFSLLLSLGAGLLFGLVPALNALTPDLTRALKEGGHASEGGSRQSFRKALVVGQVAMATVLLVLTGLFLQSFARLLRMPTGFKPAQALVMDVSLPSAKYPNETRRGNFLQQVCHRLESIPGVEAAGTAPTMPMAGGFHAGPVTVEGRKDQPEPGYFAAFDQIRGHYFRALGIPILRGRDFTEYDSLTNSPRVCLLNDQLALEIFPDVNPVGRRLRFWGHVYDIVGVSGSIRYRLHQEKPYGRLYFPDLEIDETTHRIFVRAKGERLALAGAIRKGILAIDPEQPVGNLRAMEQVVADSVSDRRFALELLSLFAGLALLLTVIGLCGVVACDATRRTNEIGIRMALGASRRSVLALMLRQGMMLALAGIGIGLAGSFALARLIANQLFGVSAADPATFVIVAALLMAATLAACYVPARRATKVDPMTTLRYE